MNEEFINVKDLTIEWLYENMPEDIKTRTEKLCLSPNTYLVHKGEPVKYVYFLCSGKVQISNNRVDGTTNRVVYVRAPQLIGEMETLVDISNSEYNAVVFETATLLKLSCEDFLAWADREHKFSNLLCRLLAKKQLSASFEVSEYIRQEAIERLCYYILSECEGEIPKNGFRLARTHAQMAESCGIGVRTVNRCVKRLVEEGYISILKGKICVDPISFEKLKLSPYNNIC